MSAEDIRYVEFVTYCIETYKSKKGIDGKTAYETLKNAGAIDYIDGNYDALHTYGDEHIVWNIDEYLRNSSSATG